jgi:hypothetical protein
MLFKGCKCDLCKTAAVGVISWSVVALGHHDQFCRDWHQHRGAYCQGVWDLPHGPHGDQRPTQQAFASIASSTGTTLP